MSDEQPLRPELSPETKLVFVLSAAFVVFRILLAAQSSFPFHQGWNEGHYALVAAGFDTHPFIPRYGESYVYNVPPLFPYAVWASFSLLGASELAARLPTILAAGMLLIATYSLGVQVFADRRTALTGTVVLATLPYFQLYGGRAQTDILMTALFTAALVFINKGYDSPRSLNPWLVLGGGMFAAAVASKQPALLLAGVVLLYLVLRQQFDHETLRRTAVLILASGIALLPLFGWLAVNYLAAPTAFVGKWEHELLHRTTAFANLPLLVTVAGFLGFTPLVLLLSGVGGTRFAKPWILDSDEPFAHPSILVIWLAVVGAFVAYRTPQGHQYYAVALLPPVALLTVKGIEIVPPLTERFDNQTVRPILLAIILLSTVTGSLVLFELSGEFSAKEWGGEQIAADAGTFLSTSVDADSRVLVASGFRPQIQWYTRDSLAADRVHSYMVSNLTTNRLCAAARKTSGSVYVVGPLPSWGETPSGMLERVYLTQSYEPTVTSVLNRPPIDGSKFGYYTSDRRLVVYLLVVTTASAPSCY